MRRTRFWYRCSTGLLAGGPLAYLSVVVGVGALAFPWLIGALDHPVPAGLWSLTLGNLSLWSLSRFFTKRHERMADLYTEAAFWDQNGEPEIARQVMAEADGMRWMP